MVKKERRRFQRASIRYKINIICEGSVMIGEPKDYTFRTYTENIGQGGIKVVLEKQLRPASLVKLELFITAKVPLKCKGLIIWNKKINPKGTKPDLFDTGIQFIDLHYSDQTVIGTMVESFLSKSQ